MWLRGHESLYMLEMPRKRAFRIGHSRTGLGLFATEPIKKRAFIVEYKGRKLTTEQADILEARGNRYLYEINSRWTIDGTTRRNLGRYANHSCRPNAEAHTIGHKVVIRAIKNIKMGDEITYDYGRDYLTNVITRRGCKCDKCRQKRAQARAKARAKARARSRRGKVRRSKARRGTRRAAMASMRRSQFSMLACSRPARSARAGRGHTGWVPPSRAGSRAPRRPKR
jgi:SET domain-containing protein